ncbi:MAG: SDR family oxidoreductase [Pseudomonadota bacterium]|nr:SDR family oxidoreductase [Pseudomonadota bacterium]
MLKNFTNKSVLITGAATGIGRALAHELANRGAVVYVTALNEKEAQIVVDEITSSNGKAIAAELDVGNFKNIEKMIDLVVSEQGQLDIMINNAGVAYVGESYDMQVETIEKLAHINFTAVNVGAVLAYTQMKKQGFGHILNTASMGGFLPTPGMAIYAATKHGVVGLTTSLASEGKDFNIVVKASCPGFIKSELMNKSSDVSNNISDYLDLLPEPIDASIAAKTIIDGLGKKPVLIFTPSYAKVSYFLNRFIPGFLARGGDDIMNKYRQAAGISK